MLFHSYVHTDGKAEFTHDSYIKMRARLETLHKDVNVKIAGIKQNIKRLESSITDDILVI